MKSIWEWLELAPTNDIAAIKQAYASQARKWHPEEHPEEFKQLQQAYKQAVQIAKRQKSVKKPVRDSQDAQTDPVLKRHENKESEINSEDRDKTADKEETVYNYNEVEQQGRLEEFWNDFYMLARNPYLANHLLMWEYLLHQNRYRALMQEASFHQSLILNVNALYGLKRKTICCIDACMKNYREEALRQGKEWTYRPKRPTPDSKLWRYKKLRFWKITTMAATKECKEAHDFLLGQVKKSGMDSTLQNMPSVKRYIGLYLDFAKVNGRQIEKWYNQGRQMQLFVKTILVMSVIMIGFAVYVNKDLEQRRKEEQVQISPQMVEELRKYNEPPQANPTPYILK